MNSSVKTKNDRLYSIDLIRFIAALYVVFYHYGFRGFAKDNMSILQFSELESFSKYGYLGVDLFFIISGFVIIMSVRNSDLIDFGISRFTRLYPAFWVSVALTALVTFFYGGIIYNVSLKQVLFNLTMLNGFFGVEHVDGVYWSLVVELKFYFLIAIVLFFNKLKHIKIFGYILLAISILQLFLPFADAPRFLQVIYYATFARWSPYFIAGMFFYFIRSEKEILKNLIPIIIAYFVAIKYALENVVYRSEVYGHNFSAIVVVLLISIFFVVIFFISINKLKLLNRKVFLYMGILTYPLYLIHQNIGFIIFNNLGSKINKWVLLFAVFTIMLIASYMINKFIEKPLGSGLRKSLKKNSLLIKLKSKLP
jgi:peptidoglycan/LPS O-acetylase OafA/YrhL